jgi:outer membrane protein assembly factor BamA
MAKQTRTTLKSFFQTGDVPTENNYADLVDSNLNLSENNTGDIQLTGEITSSGNISCIEQIPTFL